MMSEEGQNGNADGFAAKCGEETQSDESCVVCRLQFEDDADDGAAKG
eukprot:CAMPEP_0185858218 /NCGR_PEP_ID=MMETSP1354-20130828/29899_1 /TAXON_ID=708628 /ORGANISM="Erythrolobus madagascarensis, Strain CCMP3276" /LENGTH=46 /DNA_ID= /DNA_START= /DNA_END= /DNA_ORIENTATION=